VCVRVVCVVCLRCVFGVCVCVCARGMCGVFAWCVWCVCGMCVCVCVCVCARAQGSDFEGDYLSVVICPTITVLYHNSRNVLTAPRRYAQCT